MTKKGTLILWLVVIAILVIGGIVAYALISKKRGIEASTLMPITGKLCGVYWQPTQVALRVEQSTTAKAYYFGTCDKIVFGTQPPGRIKLGTIGLPSATEKVGTFYYTVPFTALQPPRGQVDITAYFAGGASTGASLAVIITPPQ